MREILFRGKCVDTGNWYEGGYIHLHKTTHCPIGDPERFPDNDIHQIVFERMTDWELPNQHLRIDVNPETVGQFTGLTDKNGKKIFEGDIIRYADIHDYNLYLESLERPEDYDGGVYDADIVTDVVVWCDEYDYPAFDLRSHDFECNGLSQLRCGDYTYEVIGNIHDNPELLKGGAEDG